MSKIQRLYCLEDSPESLIIKEEEEDITEEIPTEITWYFSSKRDSFNTETSSESNQATSDDSECSMAGPFLPISLKKIVSKTLPAQTNEITIESYSESKEFQQNRKQAGQILDIKLEPLTASLPLSQNNIHSLNSANVECLQPKVEAEDEEDDQYKKDEAKCKRSRVKLSVLDESVRYRHIRELNNLASRRLRERKKRQKVDLCNQLTILQEENMKLVTQMESLEVAKELIRNLLLGKA